MPAQNFIAASAAIILAMGSGHMWLTLFSRAFSPRDTALEERMKTVATVFNKRMLMWKSWIGFNASHSMGPILFGLVYGYLALAHAQFLLQSQFLLGLGLAFLFTYLVLAWRYWFYAPLTGIALALSLYVGGVALTFAR